MLKEAKAAGQISIGGMNTGLDRIQIITLEDLLNGKQPYLPNVSNTSKQAERKQVKVKEKTLFDYEYLF